MSVLRGKRRLPERGDTIVEVLIAMLVVSAILAGAFVTVNQSLLDERSAQEHGEALQLLQGQLESMRTVDKTTLHSQAGTFCISSAGANPVPVPAGNANCSVNSTGQPTSTQPIYHLSITRTGSDSNDQTDYYLLNATWPSVVSGGNDEAVLEYKIAQHD